MGDFSEAMEKANLDLSTQFKLHTLAAQVEQMSLEQAKEYLKQTLIMVESQRVVFKKMLAQGSPPSWPTISAGYTHPESADEH